MGRLPLGCCYVGEKEGIERINALENAGVDVIIDTAHGHSHNVVETLKISKKNLKLQLLSEI